DGIPMPLRWNPEGHGCRLQIAEPGRYLVKIQGVPQLVDQPDYTAVVLSLPALPEGQLRLTLPNSETEVEVNRRPLPVTTELQRSSQVNLPMQRQLEVRWPQ